MTDFLTLEDINSVVAEYYNVPFWSKVEIDIDSEADFDDIKFDYLTVDREQSNNQFQFGGMGGMNNMNGMMKKMQKLQKQMTAMQEELKQKTVDVTAGGGAVKITMNGEKEVKGIVIDPAAVDPEDVEMLQDLLAAAFNEASKKVDEMMASEMGKLTGGLGLPPGMF